ncbi:MAG: hypothetical protein QM703_28420 [Gemmatales bacterium]
MVSREEIVAALHRLNEAENSRPHSTVEVISAAIDQIMAPDVQGWRNGFHFPTGEFEREIEKKAFGALADYNRTFELMIVEPLIRGAHLDDPRQLQWPGRQRPRLLQLRVQR